MTLDRFPKDELSPAEIHIRDCLAQVVERTDPKHMLEDILELYHEVSEILVMRIPMTPHQRADFDEEFSFTEERVKDGLRSLRMDVTPDALRYYTIAVAVPMLIDRALEPFDKPSMPDGSRHLVTPVIKMLYEDANQAIGTIEDPDLSFRAKAVMENIKEDIGARVQRRTVLH